MYNVPMNDLYQELILDHASNPRNFGELENSTQTVRETNASCGDMAEFYFVIQENRIIDVKWRGVGCAISTASSSVVSELVKGKTIQEAKDIRKEHILKELGMQEILPTREKCLLLPLRVLALLE